jgi:[ribosomal protein S18]-alanine N-acetyltransferase
MKPGVSIIQIERATIEDISDILVIEQSAFSDPWTRSMFMAELNERNALSLTLRIDGYLAGYIFSRWVFEEWTIMNIAVRPDCRRKGLATRLMNCVIKQARSKIAQRITLEVSEKNFSAQKLYGSLGFVKVGSRPQYYAKEHADALIMELKLFFDQP